MENTTHTPTLQSPPRNADTKRDIAMLFSLRPREEFTWSEHEHVRVHRYPPKRRHETRHRAKAMQTKRRACAAAQEGRSHNWDHQHTRSNKKVNKTFKRTRAEQTRKTKADQRALGSHKFGTLMPNSEDAATLVRPVWKAHKRQPYSSNYAQNSGQRKKINTITKMPQYQLENSQKQRIRKCFFP